MPARAAVELPPEYVHFEAAGFDQTLPGHVLRLPLTDGRVLIVHMNSETAERLRLEHAASPVSRPSLRYHGGKWRLGTWIESHFPEHVCYVEPFGGSGAVLLRKKPSPLEVWNDLNGDVLNFFAILRSRTAELVRAIELTPFSRAELDLAFQPCDDPLERARRLYVRGWQCMGGPRDADSKSGWRFERTTANSNGKSNVRLWGQTDQLWAAVARLKEVQFESDDAFKIIRRFDAPTTLFYCDPPYVTSTRGERWQNVAYRYELKDADHTRLAASLHQAEGHVLISGYRCELYDRLYEGWRLETRQASTEAHTSAEECLWISPSPAERKKLWREKRAYGQLEMAIDEAAA